MKKSVVFCLTVLLILLAGCRAATGVVDWNRVTSDVGRTLADLQRQQPSYQFLHLTGLDYSVECLGRSDETFAYVFFGTQDGPGIEEAAPRYAEQLECAGVYTTVGEVFSLTNDGPIPIEDFLAPLGVDSEDPDQVEYWSGWIWFDYGGYAVAVDTGVDGEEIYAKPASKIDKSFPLMILDEKRMAANEERIKNADNP